MTPASWPREEREATRLLVVDPAAGRLGDARVADLPRLLRAGDLLVVNDAATLPASVAARAAGGPPFELRLAGADGDAWWAVAFGEGDWRQRTEDRPPPPALGAGARLTVGRSLPAVVDGVSPVSPRLVRLRFDADPDAVWAALYRDGRPVQYSYVQAPLALWHVQTPYAARPWSVEMPSAGWSLSARLRDALRAAGVNLAWLTHAAGLSSTGDRALDAALPLPERYEIPEDTVRAIRAARASSSRVVAAGTTVVRALENAAGDGVLRGGPGTATLRIDAAHRPRVVDGLLTGMHEKGTSHFDLLAAFAPAALLDEAIAHAERAGYLAHEFGDAMLVLPGG